MKEYEICPNLLNKGLVFQLYLHTKNETAQEYSETALSILQHKLKGREPNKRNPYQSMDELNQVQYVGKYFTFYKFLDMIVRVAKVTFGSQAGRKDTQVQKNFEDSDLMEAEMLCLLLERLELSKGFNNLEKETHRPHTSKVTLLPSKFVVKQLSLAKQQVMGDQKLKAVASITD